jgi:hypothetical protein
MSGERHDGGFGCARCWPPSAEAAAAARGELAVQAEIVDEPHFRVTIRACRACSQRFVSVFTEMIDWSGGDDPQYATLLPITESEAADLVGRRGTLSEAALNALGSGRRSLYRDSPKGKPPRVAWGAGIRIGPHD